MDKSSSRKAKRRTPAQDLDRFLLAFANASDFHYIENHYQDFLPPTLEFGSWVNQLRRGPEGQVSTRLPSEEARVEQMEDYRDLVRSVWEAPEGGHRRSAFRLRARLYDALEHSARLNVPKTVRRIAKGKWERLQEWKPEFGEIARDFPMTLFEEALDRLEDLAGRTKVCGNPGCTSRFFIATRGSQRYCSEKCAGVFQQAAKRDWWKRHGKEWREQHKSKR